MGPRWQHNCSRVCEPTAGDLVKSVQSDVNWAYSTGQMARPTYSRATRGAQCLYMVLAKPNAEPIQSTTVLSLNVNILWLPLALARGSESLGVTGDLRRPMLVCNTFEDVIMTQLYPKSQIAIYIQILQSDGGALSAAINATTLALIDAGIPIKDFVVGCSCSCIDGV